MYTEWKNLKKKNFYTEHDSKVGNLTRRCHEFEAGKADAEAAQLRKALAIAGSFKGKSKPTPSKTNF
jgi:hypothetical protein